MLNWSIRYSKILTDNPLLFDPGLSVVEVGCGPVGIAQFLRRPVTGIEPDPMPSQSEFLEVRPGSIVALPFGDGEIDFVLCMDVMEHLPREIRSQAIAELVRVARRKVIISCPCHSWAAEAEHGLKATFERFGIGVPMWLSEHLALGIPSIADLVTPIVATGCKFLVEGNETIAQHYAGIMLDWMFDGIGKYADRIKDKSVIAAPVGGSEWDVYYSFVFSILKAPARRAASPLSSSARPLREDRAGMYSVYHRDFPVAHLGGIKPIYSGQAALTAPPGQLTDRLADGSSLPNARWSELSAIYRIWQEGPNTDVVAFTHYRRMFDFREFGRNLPDRARQTTITAEQIPEFAGFFYSEEAVAAAKRGALVVTVRDDTVTSVFDHYCHHHNTNDYLDIFNKAADGPLLSGFLEQLTSSALFANNMFVASWDLFCELCMFWFGYLRAFEGEHLNREISTYQKRDVAFLSERIFSAWVTYRKSLGTEVIEVPIFFLEG